MGSFSRKDFAEHEFSYLLNYMKVTTDKITYQQLYRLFESHAPLVQPQMTFSPTKSQ